MALHLVDQLNLTLFLSLQLCSKLANAKDATGEMLLPTFDNPETPNKRVDLRRLLLNKCQVEFEKGIEADSKVKAREEKETKGGEEVRWNVKVLMFIAFPSAFFTVTCVHLQVP